jgi:hypothetical protein
MDLDPCAEKAKLLESGASSSQIHRAVTAQLSSENTWKGAIVKLGLDFVGAAWFYLLLFELVIEADK